MTSVYCTVPEKGKLAFYLNVNGKTYYLFMQRYKRSTKEYFYKGRPISCVFDMSGVRSVATRKTIEKLRTSIPYIEKEYGLCVLKSSEKKNKKTTPYKRQRFSSRELNDIMTVAI